VEVADLLAQSPTAPFVIDGGVSGIIVGALALAGVIVQTVRADIAGKRAAAATETKAGGEHDLGVTEQAKEFQKYVREEVKAAVEEATRELRGELAAVRAGLGRVLGRFRHMRRAFREYELEVVAKWGKSDGPPRVSTDVRAMLYDDDMLDLEDTFTRDEVRALRADAAEADQG